MLAPGMLFGGLAAILHGVSRATRDVAATLVGGTASLEQTLATLGQHGIGPRIPEALAFAGRHHVLLLRHEASGVDVDITLAWLPFELEAIASAPTMTIADIRLPVVRPEDLVIYKVVAWRPQDKQDVERLLAGHGDVIDLGRARRVLAEFASAIEEPERLDEFERVVRSLGL
jgi:hypothetical protein